MPGGTGGRGRGRGGRGRGRRSSKIGTLPGVFTVEKIMQKKINPDGTVMYLIHWLDYPHSTNTWEPVSNLTGCDEALEEFENALRTNPKQEPDDEHEAEPEIAILDHIPVGKEAELIKNFVTGKDGRNLFFIQWKMAEGGDENSSDNFALVDVEMFKLAYPQLVIAFYEKNITWIK